MLVVISNFYYYLFVHLIGSTTRCPAQQCFLILWSDCIISDSSVFQPYHICKSYYFKAQLKYHNHPFSSDFLSMKSSLSPLIILTCHSRYLLMLIALGTILLYSVVFFVEAEAIIYVSLCIPSHHEQFLTGI